MFLGLLLPSSMFQLALLLLYCYHKILAVLKARTKRQRRYKKRRKKKRRKSLPKRKAKVWENRPRLGGKWRYQRQQRKTYKKAKKEKKKEQWKTQKWKLVKPEITTKPENLLACWKQANYLLISQLCTKWQLRNQDIHVFFGQNSSTAFSRRTQKESGCLPPAVRSSPAGKKVRTKSSQLPSQLECHTVLYFGKHSKVTKKVCVKHKREATSTKRMECGTSNKWTLAGPKSVKTTWSCLVAQQRCLWMNSMTWEASWKKGRGQSMESKLLTWSRIPMLPLLGVAEAQRWCKMFLLHQHR